MPVKLLNLTDAAHFLSMDEKVLRSMAMAGEVPSVMQGARLMFEREELDNWYTNRLLHHQPLDASNTAHQQLVAQTIEQINQLKHAIQNQ